MVKSGLGWGMPILLVALCFCLSAARAETETDEKIKSVAIYVDAFNVRDFETMGRLMHEDVEWISVSGSSQEIMTSSKDALLDLLTTSYSDDYTGKSEMTGAIRNGRFVSGIERSTYVNGKGEEKAASSNVLYEFDGKLIRRVWYFPAVAE